MDVTTIAAIYVEGLLHDARQPARPSESGRIAATRRMICSSLDSLAEQHLRSNLFDGQFSRPDEIAARISGPIAEADVIFIYYRGAARQFGHNRFSVSFGDRHADDPKHYLNLSTLTRDIETASNAHVIWIIDWTRLTATSAINTTRIGRRSTVTVKARAEVGRNYLDTSADLWTGAMCDVLGNMRGAVPRLSISELASVFSQYIGYRGSCNLFGTEREQSHPIHFDISGSLWSKDEERLGSSNSGSREDGLQGLMHSDCVGQARLIAAYMAACDESPSVRTSAGTVFESLKYGRLRSNRSRNNAPQSTKSVDRFRFEAPSHAIRHIDDFESALCGSFRTIPTGFYWIGSDHDVNRGKFSPIDLDRVDVQRAFPEEFGSPEPVQIEEFEILDAPVQRQTWLDYLSGSIGLCDPKSNPERIRDWDFPATYVSWYEAMDFCRYLTDADPSDKYLYRLPTEAEWEASARGPHGYLYPWGDEFSSSFCNCRSSAVNMIEPVRARDANKSAFEVRDLIGNTWEWTLSLWGRTGHNPEFGYPYAPNDGRNNALARADVRRIIRGGAFYYFDYCLRAATRNLMYPSTHHSAGSFRVVRVKKP